MSCENSGAPPRTKSPIPRHLPERSPTRRNSGRYSPRVSRRVTTRARAHTLTHSHTHISVSLNMSIARACVRRQLCVREIQLESRMESRIDKGRPGVTLRSRCRHESDLRRSISASPMPACARRVGQTSPRVHMPMRALCVVTYVGRGHGPH